MADSMTAPRLSCRGSVEPSVVSMKTCAFRSPRLSALFREGEKKVETLQRPPEGTSGLWSSTGITLIGLPPTFFVTPRSEGGAVD